MARLSVGLLLATAAVVTALYAMNVTFSITEEEAIQRELRLATTTEELNRRIDEALVRDDIEDALMYAEVAAYMNRTLSPETQERLVAAQSGAAAALRSTTGFASGFVTGGGDSIAELAGAVTSDLTVVGDVRDIVIEGGKMIVGEDYSPLILGLSVVGIAVTGATVATGGGGAPVRLGVSIVKLARRTGNLTVEFAQTLGRMTAQAVNPAELARLLRQTNLTDMRATQNAIANYAGGVRQAQIFTVMTRMGDIGRTAGPGEAVRLLRYVRTAEELDDVAGMSARLGRKTRGVIELTGRTGLRAFKTALNVFEFLLERILAFGTWLLVLFGLGVGRNIVRRGRHSRPF